MKNLRQLARRSGLLSNGKRRRRNDGSQRSGSGGRSLRTETLEKRQLLAGDAFAPEHNYWNAYDVNDDGQITARDALAVINRVSSGISSAEAEQTDSGSNDQMFPDVNADFAVTALDALTVINAVSRGEETGELVELQLRALSDPTDGTSTVSQIGVNEVFHLEVSYNDLRQNSLGNVVRIGAFQVFTDLVTDQAGVLSPVLNETQVLVIDNSVLSTTIDTVEFTREGSTDTFSATFNDFGGAPEATIASALNSFGLNNNQFTVTDRTQRDNNDVITEVRYEIFYSDTAFGNQDLPDLSIGFTEAAGQPDVPTQTQEFAPFLADGTTPNTDAVRFNIDFLSRTFNDNEQFYGELLFDGDFNQANGFTNIGGLGPADGGGVPSQTDDGGFINPFDVFSFPVFLNQDVTNLGISVQPAAGNNEAVLLYGRNDALPTDLILVDEDAQITISTTTAVDNGTLSVADISVDEGAGTADVTVTRTSSTAGVVTVNVATSDGTATAGSDYTSTTQTLTFNDGVATQTFSVPITDDAVVESSETFSVTLTGPGGGAVLGTATATVTITDNDTAAAAGVVTIDPASINVNEAAGTVTLSVLRTGGTSGAIGVTVNTADGTATGGSDFDAIANQTVQFADGESTAQTVTINITNDTLDESNESFTVNLSTPTGGATLGTTTSAAVTIIDDDGVVTLPGTIAISPTAVSVNEADGTATFTVTRTGGTDGAVAVTVNTANGTAVAGSDFTALTNQTVQFADGDGADKTVTVSITDDAVVEGSETFTVNLSGPTGSATLGTASTGTVTIVDNDVAVQPGVISISPTATSVDENAGTVTFTIARTGGSDGAVSVSVATANGTAIAGQDFESNTGTITFADGDSTSQTFSVAITDDSILEEGASETFTVNLSSPTGGATLGAATATVTIVDNEVANVAPTSGAVSVSAVEDTPTTFTAATLLASASAGESGQTVSISAVSAGSAGGTAVLNSSGGLDYTPADDFFGAETFTVTIVDDGTPVGTGTYTLTVNVAGVNDPPTVPNTTEVVFTDTTSNINVLAGASAGPGENQNLTVVSASSPNGQVAIINGTSLQFTPTAGFDGDTTISYTVQDSDNAQASAVVSVTVQDFIPSTVTGEIFIDNIDNIQEVLAGADPTRNGIKDAEDAGIGGIQVRLVSSTGATIAAARTRLDGSYEFINVAPGDYTVVYDIPDSVRAIGSSSAAISVNPTSPNPTPTGPSLTLSGLNNSGIETINILASSYLRANSTVAADSDGGREGGMVAFDDSGVQEIFIAGEGFDGVVFSELLLNQAQDSALLIIVREGATSAEVATVGEENLIVGGDGSGAQFFGGLDDFDFAVANSGQVSAEFAGFAAAIDRAIAQL